MSVVLSEKLDHRISLAAVISTYKEEKKKSLEESDLIITTCEIILKEKKKPTGWDQPGLRFHYLSPPESFRSFHLSSSLETSESLTKSASVCT